MSGIWAAVFGFIGTLVGGGVTYAVNRLNVLQQREQAAHVRNQHVLDRRYMAHLEYLNRTSRFIDHARVLRSELNAPSERLETVSSVYSDAWQAYYETADAVHLAGPDELIEVVQAFQEAVRVYSVHLDDWYESAPGPRQRKDWEGECEAKHDQVTLMRRQYLNAARPLLSR